MPELRLSRRARDDIASLPHELQARILDVLTLLAARPDEVGKPLAGRMRGLWSARVGNYRIIYSIEGGLVLMRAVRHRVAAYRRRSS